MKGLFLEEIPNNTLMIKNIDGVLYVGGYHETYYTKEPNVLYRGFEPLFPLKENVTENDIIEILDKQRG